MSNRRDPFEAIDRMIEQMRRSMLELDDQLAAFETPALESPASETGSLGMAGESNVTVESTEDGYVVVADLPGFETSEIDLRFADGQLVLTAEREADEETDQSRSLRRRNVREGVSIPGPVVESEITATYRNGVLEVRLPTEPESDDATQIDVE